MSMATFDNISTADFEDSVEIHLHNKNKELEVAKEISLETGIGKVKKSVHEFYSQSVQTKKVTVFRDQAEVNRLIRVEAETGDVEVVIRQLPCVVDKDSVRVACSNNEVTIVEVSFKTKLIIENGTSEGEAKQNVEDESEKINKRLAALKKERNILSEKLKRNAKEALLIESYANCISEKKGDKVAEILDKKNIESMLHFLSIYKDRSEKISDSTILLNENMESIDKEIDALADNLNMISPSINFRQESFLSILLDVKKSDAIELVVSYVVQNCASWSPCYDIRAFSNDNIVQILYFANIQQSTGEDWNNCKLFLSTALPSIGGSPPELQPQILYFNFVIDNTYSSRKSYAPESLCESSSAYASAKVNESLTNANFEITRLASIPSDGNAHKVSICQLDFIPQFEYMTTPKSVAHAFLKLKVNNNSAYTLLGGYANVFLDNNYLTRSCLPAVSPMEDFEIALGVDPAIKVTYKPLRKFHQTSGVLSKLEVFDFHQMIEVKNTKRERIKIKVTDQCPRSTNEKIKVTLQEPEIKIPKSISNNEPLIVNHDNASLTTTDFKIDWLLDLGSNETKIINLRYQLFFK